MGRKQRSGPRDDSKQYAKITSDSMSNAWFSEYYEQQGILSTDDTAKMMQAFRDPLPTTFRVTGTRQQADALNDLIKTTYVPFLHGVRSDAGHSLAPLEQISWYPRQLGWSLNVEKQIIRKSPNYRKFQDFLVHESEAGNITRQELVSMIPPLLLDIQSHHYVLDTCAAPGSKTVQLLEALHAKDDEGSPATGVLIANDGDLKRTHMLVHQSLNRVGSPNMMVTQQDAAIYTSIKRSKDGELVMFDRILADVPCTGDGTLRKNIAIWRTWNSNQAIGLHSIQLRILLRSIKMLKPGGRVVYSTCSINPIEDEAVVSAALTAAPDMHLVDVSAELLGLARAPGIADWKVIPDSKSGKAEIIERPQNGAKERVHNDKKLPLSLWPHGDEKQKNIDRCLRLYPHLNNSGGFFVAVLEKRAEPEASTSKRAASPSEPEAKRVRTNGDADVADAAPIAGSSTAASSQKKKDKAPHTNAQFKEDPYSYVAPDNEEIKSFIKFFNVSDAFNASTLMVRNDSGTPLRTVYRTSPSVKDIVDANDFRAIRLISCGSRALSRQDANRDGTYACKWRLLHESLDNMLPFLGPERIIKASVSSLRTLVKGQYVGISEFSDAAFGETLSKLDNGSAIIEIAAGEVVEEADLPAGSVAMKMTLPVWKAPTSVQLMVDKKAKQALSMRVFGKDICTWQGKQNQPPEPGPPAKLEGEDVKAVDEASDVRPVPDKAVTEDVKPNASPDEKPAL